MFQSVQGGFTYELHGCQRGFWGYNWDVERQKASGFPRPPQTPTKHEGVPNMHRQTLPPEISDAVTRARLNASTARPTAHPQSRSETAEDEALERTSAEGEGKAHFLAELLPVLETGKRGDVAGGFLDRSGPDPGKAGGLSPGPQRKHDSSVRGGRTASSGACGCTWSTWAGRSWRLLWCCPGKRRRVQELTRSPQSRGR